jgi:hypothetical protein
VLYSSTNRNKLKQEEGDIIEVYTYSMQLYQSFVLIIRTCGGWNRSPGASLFEAEPRLLTDRVSAKVLGGCMASRLRSKGALKHRAPLTLRLQ